MIDPSFLSGANAAYVAELYETWLRDPQAVDAAWHPFFEELGDDLESLAPDFHGPGWGARGGHVIAGAETPGREPAPAPPAAAAEVDRRIKDAIRALMLIRTYRVRGHLAANLDPLGLQSKEKDQVHPELRIDHHGFREEDLGREIFINGVLGVESAPLREILDILRQTYCGTIGVEFMHIQNPEEKQWIQRRVESNRNQPNFTEAGKRAILQRLVEAEGFERFLQAKYPTTKRFGLEGGESVVPALEQILKRGCLPPDDDLPPVEEVVLGMAHRGRLNVLTNLLHKPFAQVFAEFEGDVYVDEVLGSGDVKYHLGTSGDRYFEGEDGTGRVVHLSLQSNPSHLEAVDPVVLGKVRARQTRQGDAERRRIVPLLLHGDAAFAGQGVVAECLSLSGLHGYRVGGTLHIIINNQIGFTTAPHHARSGEYASDVAKMVQAPILHVNGDDVEAVVHAARMALDYRQRFGRDVVLDVVCYRRQGHNESDEPAFTQPVMYQKIRQHPTTREVYTRKLVAEGLLSEHEAQGMVDKFRQRLEREFAASNTWESSGADWLQGAWEGLVRLDSEEEWRQDPTGVSPDLLTQVGTALTTVPKHLNLNSKIARLLATRRQRLETGEGLDWALAEALAFGTLLMEGHPVRLSGQDSGRGTFSQRHVRLVDQTTEETYVSLNHIGPGQKTFEVWDSPLAEMSVLGFEYGYSLASPFGLTVWEAQFGDFANGAQVIIDQFLASAESKWHRMSGLTMLLPHGYEGQGPEHSSARLERYLQLCAEDNIHVCNVTTPANYFHVLRRQVRRNFRKPLILMTPKSLLRHKLCVSSNSALVGDSRFHRVLPEVDPLDDSAVTRVVLCTGKVYYDLLQARREQALTNVALIRVEQLYPWPKDTLKHQLERYPQAELLWCQEEPANMGAWLFVMPRLTFLLEELGHSWHRPLFVGRRAAASPATGRHATHVQEQESLVSQALMAAPEGLHQPFQRITHLSDMGN